ncbi:Endonuclease/exonuclease/phosphatase [Phytophthora cactorum]|nr:Endonuclease/exonuclease/phosphatase [Phytophthora cactorum]
MQVSLDLPNGDESDIDHELLSRASARGSVGAIVHFEHLETQLEFVVATTHLFWDPMQEDVKLLQSRRMLRAIEGFVTTLDASTPIIFSGDFNSLPDSKVYSFITNKNHFRSAYAHYNSDGEPKFTNVNGGAKTDDGKMVPRFVGTLDYIFYRSARCDAAGSAHGAHVVRRRQQGGRTAQYDLSVRPPTAPVRVPHPASFQLTSVELNMGASSSTPSAATGSAVVEQIFASAQEKAAFEKIVGETPVPREDAAYHTVLATPKPLPQLTQAQVELLTREYGETLDSLSIQMEDERAGKSNNDELSPEDSSGDLAVHFLDALLTALIEFPPNEKTYDLHVEVVNTLLVLLSPVAYPRDHSKQAGDLRAHNPFLYMLMTSALPDGKKSYWASGLVRRLLQNNIEQVQATGPSSASNTAVIALRKTHEMSLIAMSGSSDQAYEQEQFSYFTLEGVSSIAGGYTSIFRFPWSFIRYFTTREDTASPLADRSVLLLLVLLQSCRDSDSPVDNNPFRGALCGITDGADTDGHGTEMEDPRAHLMQQSEATSSSSAEKLELLYSDLFAVVGRHAPYEASHLMLYTLLYSNPMMLDIAVNDADMERLLLPLLETLYHARTVEPSRLYMLVIVLLTFTQDPSFVRTAHTQLVVSNVSWYQEHYMLDVSLGSLMMVIFTRLIFRNITHFQDSFIHLNAFAALSNLARSAENLHMYAAQGIVGLIDMLAKNEAKLVAQMQRLKSTDKEESEVLAQKQSAYVEFIRLLLGVVSSCLKAKQLPRNPQLIYSLLHRADTFGVLQQHSEFAAHVNNGPVWSTLARFQAVVDAKTTPDDALDADTVLDIIRGECVSLLASSSARSRTGGASRSKASVDDDDASYRYEEEADPEQFFVPYIWKLIQEQTPDFCWKGDKITLFVPSGISAPTSVTTGKGHRISLDGWIGRVSVRASLRTVAILRSAKLGSTNEASWILAL